MDETKDNDKQMEPTEEQKEKIKRLKKYCDDNGIDWCDEEPDELSEGQTVIIAIWYMTGED